MADKKYKFENLFKITTKSMKLIGAHPMSKRNWFHNIMIFLVNLFLVICFLFICYSIIFHDFPNKNYPEVIKNGIMVTVALMSIAKYNILIYYKETFRELIDKMDQDIIDSEDYPPEEKEIVSTYIKKKIRVYHLWGACAVITCTVFPIKSFALMFYYAYYKKELTLIPVFDFTLPGFLNDVKTIPFFFSILQSVEMGFDTYTLITCLSFDSLAPIFLLHCCSELQLLRLRLTNTFLKESDPQIILKQLKDINVRLQYIYRFVSYAQGIFRTLYEFIMKITIILVSFSGFQVMQALQRQEITLEFSFFFFASFIQFFLPCYYSDLLMETGEIFRESIYSCGWEMKSDIKIRKTILFMLTRTMSPIVISTFFVPICLDTFAETCRQAYAIYNILMAVE